MKLLNRLFIALTVAGLATMLVSVSAHAGDLTFDGKGNLFVSDGDSHSIRKFTPEGVKSTFASGLSNPGDLTFDGKGNLFVLDDDSHSIRKFTPAGVKSTFASGLRRVGGLALDGAGNLFVSDYDSHSIRKFTPAGVKSTFATGLKEPLGMAFDRSGNLFVYDVIEGSIFKFTPDGVKSTFASVLSDPNGMVFDRSGNLFVPDYDSHLIFKFDPDGTKSTFASDRVSPDKQWEYQCDVLSERAGIVKAGTTQAVLDLSEDVASLAANDAEVVWAPDSKRFAFNYGQGREHHTALYQLRGNEWKALKRPGDNDEISAAVKDAIAAQLKRKGLPKETQLREFWTTEKVHQWVDSSTAIVYAASDKTAERKELDFRAAFLSTLKFDGAGNWKIIKTHRMSDKEFEAFYRNE